MIDISFYSEPVSRNHPQITSSRNQIAVHSENIQPYSFGEKGVRARGQMAETPVFPILDRAHPVLDWLKTRTPLVPRTKMIGKFGVVDPIRGQRYGARSAGGQYTTEAIIPKVYPVQHNWPASRDIGRLPSIIASTITTGPTRTVLPQKLHDVERKTVAARVISIA